MEDLNPGQDETSMKYQVAQARSYLQLAQTSKGLGNYKLTCSDYWHCIYSIFVLSSDQSEISNSVSWSLLLSNIYITVKPACHFC